MTCRGNHPVSAMLPPDFICLIVVAPQLSERALLLESKERWATSAVRSNLYYWSELTQTKLIKLHKIEFALGHYSRCSASYCCPFPHGRRFTVNQGHQSPYCHAFFSVLTKMIMREWRISVHHDLLAREHLMKASMYSMWCRLAQYAATRSSKVQSALRVSHAKLLLSL